jgi:hypothetical protein
MSSALVDIENQSDFTETPVCSKFVANDRSQSENLPIARWGWELGDPTAYGSSIRPRKLWTEAGLDNIQWQVYEAIDVAPLLAVAPSRAQLYLDLLVNQRGI